MTRLKTLLDNTFFEWQGDPIILMTTHYKTILKNHPLLIGLKIDSKYEGVVILGQVEIVVDTLIHNEKYGSVGNTINFKGTNLVILGLSIEELGENIITKTLDKKTFDDNFRQAEIMISKLKNTLDRPDININIDHDCDEKSHIIFARRNFFLIGTDNKTILINNKQISIKEGESKLIEIDPINGILIANSEKLFSLGSFSKDKISILGQFGVNLASSFLKNLVWD